MTLVPAVLKAGKQQTWLKWIHNKKKCAAARKYIWAEHGVLQLPFQNSPPSSQAF